MERIIRSRVLFLVAVMDSAVKTGKWVVVGHSNLPPELATLPPKFIQDAIRKDQFSIYENGKTRLATREECVGLSRASIWSAEHVEERIVDHFAGRPNKWELRDRLPLTSTVQ
jgi:hypothetical protein